MDLVSNSVMILPNSITPTTTTFILRVDGVSQELNETFDLRIVNISASQFSNFTDELVVTILDSNGK